MDITQSFYDSLAPQYEKLFQDWDTEIREQAQFLHRLMAQYGFKKPVRILDCACGIGTQAIGLAELGYDVTASDLSSGALAEAQARAARHAVSIRFAQADFRKLEQVFPGQFDVVLAMDNALPHMLTAEDLEAAVGSIAARVAPGGLFLASIRDYDALLETRPPYSPPYIHKTRDGQRVSFQTWHWNGCRYRLVQYILDDGKTLEASKFECEYRATARQELTDLLLAHGYKSVTWKFPEETGFYQPLVIAEK